MKCFISKFLVWLKHQRFSGQIISIHNFCSTLIKNNCKHAVLPGCFSLIARTDFCVLQSMLHKMSPVNINNKSHYYLKSATAVLAHLFTFSLPSAWHNLFIYIFTLPPHCVFSRFFMTWCLDSMVQGKPRSLSAHSRSSFVGLSELILPECFHFAFNQLMCPNRT